MSTILELNNIKKAYDVKMAVDIDKLVIEDGDCVGLVGGKRLRKKHACWNYNEYS